MVVGIPRIWFNNSRPDGNKLDSSPVRLQLIIRDKSALQHLRSLPSLAQSIRVEVVGVNAQFLFHFVEGNMLPVPEPTIETATVSEEHESVLVSVKRSLPLSSSHGGQPLRLAFVVPGGHVFVSESFQVLAKQGKAGTPLKAVAHKRVPPVTEMRAEARAAIAMYTSHALVSDAGLSTHGPLQVTLPVDASIAAIVSCSAHRKGAADASLATEDGIEVNSMRSSSFPCVSAAVAPGGMSPGSRSINSAKRPRTPSPVRSRSPRRDDLFENTAASVFFSDAADCTLHVPTSFLPASSSGDVAAFADFSLLDY